MRRARSDQSPDRLAPSAAGVLLLLALVGPAFAQKPRDKVGAAPRPAPPAAAAPRLGSLLVVTDPAGAEILLYHLGGKRQALKARATSDAGGSHTFASLAAGRYRVVARYPEHGEFADEVSIVAGQPRTVTAKLRPKFGYLVLTGPGLDAEARITIDGRRPGERDTVRESDETLRIKAPPGAHEVRVERTGRVPFVAAVSVDAGEEHTSYVTLALVRATVVVRSAAGARVFVDERPAGTVPSTGKLVVESVEPGRPHEIRLELDDHEPFARTVTPVAGVETTVEARLTPLPTSGAFEETFLGGLASWDAPSSWSADPSTGVLTVRGGGIGLPKGVRYRDCEISFNLGLVDGRGAAWVVHARDARNGYLFHLSGPTARWPNQLRVYVVRDGRIDAEHPASAPLPVDPPLTVGDFYRIRIHVEGSVISHWITSGATGEEVSIGLFRDLDDAFPLGAAGFTTVDGCEFRVEGFVIRPLPLTSVLKRP